MSFRKVSCCLAVGTVAALLFHAEARAQTAPTCTFNPTTAVLTINVDGIAATLTRTGVGIIRLNSVACTGATTLNTDRIVIRGGPLNDVVAISGTFEPGLTAETDAFNEIEIQLTSIQVFTWTLGGGDDTLVFANGGLDLGGDGDVDIRGAVIRNIQGGGGSDLLDFSEHGGNFTLGGGNGSDELIGGNGQNTLLGGPDDDIMRGGPGNDHLEGGPGDDMEFGDGGIDRFDQNAADNGSDIMIGGPQIDTVDYSARSVGVNVTLAAGADDGEAGEGDDVGAGVENVLGGSGDDILVGSAARNRLTGGDGNDELFGGANTDFLLGGLGDDFLQGDAGANSLFGEDGNDILVGGVNVEKFFGGAGDDEITGNTDGRAEPVNCGDGMDTAELNDEDNFIDCEL